MEFVKNEDKKKELEEQQSKLEELRDKLDKKLIEQMFEQGVKCKVWKPYEWYDTLTFNYTIGKFNYMLVRRPNNTNTEATQLIHARNIEMQKLQQQAKSSALMMQGKYANSLRNGRRF